MIDDSPKVVCDVVFMVILHLFFCKSYGFKLFFRLPGFNDSRWPQRRHLLSFPRRLKQSTTSGCWNRLWYQSNPKTNEIDLLCRLAPTWDHTENRSFSIFKPLLHHFWRVRRPQCLIFGALEFKTSSGGTGPLYRYSLGLNYCVNLLHQCTRVWPDCSMSPGFASSHAAEAAAQLAGPFLLAWWS